MKRLIVFMSLVLGFFVLNFINVDGASAIGLDVLTGNWERVGGMSDTDYLDLRVYNWRQGENTSLNDFAMDLLISEYDGYFQIVNFPYHKQGNYEFFEFKLSNPNDDYFYNVILHEKVRSVSLVFSDYYDCLLLYIGTDFSGGFEDWDDVYQYDINSTITISYTITTIPDYGYQDGYDDGFNDGYGVGLGQNNYEKYQKGYNDGVRDGSEGEYTRGYSVGYVDGANGAVVAFTKSSELIYHDITLPNGVKDEIVDNSKLVDRVGRAVFNGAENTWSVSTIRSSTVRLSTTELQSSVKVVDGANHSLLLNNLFTPDVQSFFDDNEGVMVGGGSKNLFVSISKTKIGYQEGWTNAQTINAFKTWLASNNLEIYYELAEPKEYNLIPLLTNADGSFVDGFKEGKRVGLKDVESSLNFGSLLGSIFISMGSFLAINLLPGISIGAIIAVPLVFGIIAFIIGRKKE